MNRVNSEAELLSSASHIDPGESRSYSLGWNISRADAEHLGLKLSRHRTGSTFRVTKLGDREIRVEATESPRGFTITGSQPVDLRSLERDLGRRR